MDVALGTQGENSAYMLELAVNDLRRAADIEPDNIDVKRLLKVYSAEMKDQNK
jgi:hypothetical protein